MYLTDELQKKWQKVLDHPELPAVKDAHKRAVLTVLLENQETEARKERGIITEAVPANHGGLATQTTAANGTANSAVQAYDPVLISLLRRALPNLVAFDICGVQPMKAPTGLIFAMKSRYASQAGAEALFAEADTGHSGGGEAQAADPFSTTAGGVPTQGDVGRALRSTDGEGLGNGAGAGVGSNGGQFAEMAFSIEKVSVEAKTRALKAEYTMELAQDLRAVHGLDAETELANILSAEILAEINREVVRTVFNSARLGAATTATAGVFDLDVDSNGRWSVEKYKGLMVQIEREANAIAKATRRGRGNILICDSDTASALSVAGLLDCGSALKDSLSVDDTGNTFVGVLNGRFKVYIDPHATKNFLVAGFKGANQYDAGLFYCPYVPLQMVRAVHQDSFQPKIGFKTRYGLVANPFSTANVTQDAGLNDGANNYYRKIAIKNLL